MLQLTRLVCVACVCRRLAALACSYCLCVERVPLLAVQQVTADSRFLRKFCSRPPTLISEGSGEDIVLKSRAVCHLTEKDVDVCSVCSVSCHAAPALSRRCARNSLHSCCVLRLYLDYVWPVLARWKHRKLGIKRPGSPAIDVGVNGASVSFCP